MEFVFTKEKEWLDKWDLFVKNNPKGSHLILSDWLKSYNSYGFDFTVSIILKDNVIVGGCGVIIPKFLFFKFYIIPHGPIYSIGCDSFLNEHLLQLKKHAKRIGCCYMQFSIPFSSSLKVIEHTCQKQMRPSIDHLFKQGKLFQYVYSSYGLNWIDLKEYKNSDFFLEQLTSKVRRNVRMPYNKKAEAFFVTDFESIEKGYQVIEENAKYANYSVRPFNGFKHTIMGLINKKQAYFVICKVEGVIKAAAFFIETSGYITNIMGGVLREKPDIKLGYMIQWEIIKKSFECGFNGYNISMGGSHGVQDFKSKFGTETIYYETPDYYTIIKPLYFSMFKFFDKYLKRYKSEVSKILSRLKK